MNAYGSCNQKKLANDSARIGRPGDYSIVYTSVIEDLFRNKG